MPDSRQILPKIHMIRGHRVVVDSDLADLYGIPTMRLNEAVRRNAERFPPDFTFLLTRQELANLISQSAISSSHGGRRKPVRVFTEHGALMAGNVLNSAEAVQMSLFLVRAFVRMRETLAPNAQVLQRLAEIDRVYQGRLAEREIFLKQQLDAAYAAQKAEDVEKISQQRVSERARLEEEYLRYHREFRDRKRRIPSAGWRAEFVFLVNLPEYVSFGMFHGLLIDAGRLVGVGDFRPTYGRFQVVAIERQD